MPTRSTPSVLSPARPRDLPHAHPDLVTEDVAGDVAQVDGPGAVGPAEVSVERAAQRVGRRPAGSGTPTDRWSQVAVSGS
ncbi:hypothetical protein [Haloactinopolyspora sp.]|uniref:hypothetical protein n=1 Tax=Haloactinopolyspora sp. TaxID=1966353 RepID=UPI0026114B18|nr:hypothetical protein [Haloactinopolyspora sp.]